MYGFWLWRSASGFGQGGDCGLAKIVFDIGFVNITFSGKTGSNFNDEADAFPMIVIPETGGGSVPWQRFIRLRTSPMEVGPMAGRLVI